MFHNTLRFFLFFSGLCLGIGVSDAQNDPVNIGEAAKNNHIQYKVTGMWHPDNPSDYNGADGMYYGRCMQLMLKNISADTLFLILPRGMILLSEDSKVQDMLVTQSLEFKMYPRDSKLYSFYSMCSEMHDDMPSLRTKYRFGEMGDSLMQRLAEVIDRNFMQNMAGQHALWAYTDQAKFTDLKKYGATAGSITISLKLLHEAGIQNNLATELHYEGAIDMVQARDSLIRRLNKKMTQLSVEHEEYEKKINIDPIWFYTGLTVLILWGGAASVLALRSGRGKDNQG